MVLMLSAWCVQTCRRDACLSLSDAHAVNEHARALTVRRYVDIEFGLYGALCVGFLVGGLGKMPGVYSRPTTYNRVFLKEQFMLALNTAFSIPQVRVASLASSSTCPAPQAFLNASEGRSPAAPPPKHVSTQAQH